MIFLLGFGQFLLSLAVHVVHWRYSRPANELGALAWQFILAPALLLALFIFLAPELFPGPSWRLWAQAMTLHLSLSGVYVSSYPAVQAYSPSLEILLCYRNDSRIGLTEEDFSRLFDRSKIISRSLEELIRSKLVRYKNGRYELTWLSRALAHVLAAHRRLLGLSVKGK